MEKDNTQNLNESLTEREAEVIKHVIQGKTNREIAEILMITHHTVKAHIASIIRKTETRNRLEAAIALFNRGYINPLQD